MSQRAHLSSRSVLVIGSKPEKFLGLNSIGSIRSPVISWSIRIRKNRPINQMASTGLPPTRPQDAGLRLTLILPIPYTLVELCAQCIDSLAGIRRNRDNRLLRETGTEIGQILFCAFKVHFVCYNYPLKF